jgi:hypothetical protein
MIAITVVGHTLIRRTGGHIIIPITGIAAIRGGMTSTTPIGIAIELVGVTHPRKPRAEVRGFLNAARNDRFPVDLSEAFAASQAAFDATLRCDCLFLL